MKKVIFASAIFLFISPFIASAHEGMMGFGSVWPWIMGLNFVVWLIVGIFVIIWLWKKIV